jgi:hypothetical protein
MRTSDYELIDREDSHAISHFAGFFFLSFLITSSGIEGLAAQPSLARHTDEIAPGVNSIPHVGAPHREHVVKWGRPMTRFTFGMTQSPLHLRLT